jgi:hypothetical protein
MRQHSGEGDRLVTRALGRLLGAVMGVVLLTMPAAPAAAIDSEGSESDGTTSPGANTGGTTGSGGTQTGQIGNCTAVAGPNYLGLACGSYTGGTLTVKEILGKDPVPDCWHEPLTASELAAMELQNTPEPDASTWYWERCLHGIDKKTKTIGPEGVSFTIGLVSLDPDDAKKLTDNQADLVDFQGVDQQVPAPVVVASPSARPRVGADVSFFDPVDNVVEAMAGNVLLRAEVTQLEVQPLGEGMGDVVTCPGTGHRAEPGDSPATHPDACWYRYQRSSAGQPSNSEGVPSYPVVVTEQWTVTSSLNGGPAQLFTTFEKSQITSLPVTEIQTLVVR